MARPTSSKNIFALTKYSRAILRQQDPRGTNTQGPKGDCDWQHHTQPTLRLLLETRKSPQGVPEQMRLRIVWSAINGHTPVANNKTPLQQENVIFEDIDLLVVRRHIHPFPTQGLPLKAVFRDNMVGIRFLPPHAKSSRPSEYRRFQITFQISSDSAALIEAIRDVCPCKPSPINYLQAVSLDSRSSFPGQGRSEAAQNTQQPQAHFSSQSQSFQTPSGDRFDSTLQCLNEGAAIVPPSQPNMLSDLPIDFAVPFRQSSQNISVHSLDQRFHAYQSRALARHQSMAQQTTQRDLSSSCPYAPSPFHSEVLNPSDIQLNSRPPSICNSAMRESEVIASDPNASLPVAMPTPPTSSQGPSTTSINNASGSSRAPLSDGNDGSDAISTAPTKHPLLESLYEACRLEDLPRNELEQLVAHIVREDSFVDLLQKIDSLWQLRAIVNL